MISECKHDSATQFCNHCDSDKFCGYYGWCIHKGEIIYQGRNDLELILALNQIKDELDKRMNYKGVEVIDKAISELEDKYRNEIGNAIYKWDNI